MSVRRAILAGSAVLALAGGAGPARSVEAAVTNCTWTHSADFQTHTVRCTTGAASIYRAKGTCRQTSTGYVLVRYGSWEAYRHPSTFSCPSGYTTIGWASQSN